MATLNPFHRFPGEAAAVGRLLLGYGNLEIGLMNCVQMAFGGKGDNSIMPSLSFDGACTYETNMHIGYCGTITAGSWPSPILRASQKFKGQ